MSYQENVLCPCCGGDGEDKYFDLPDCIVCDGEGYIHNIEVNGTKDYLNFSNHEMFLSVIEKDLILAKDLWDYFYHYNKDNWWVAHASVPMLEEIEKILLAKNKLMLSDIPGGPNNPTHPKMVARAKEIEQAILDIAEEMRKAPGDTMGNPNYNSYGQRKKANQKFRDKIKQKAAQSAQEVMSDADKTAPQSTPTEETIMSDSNTVVDRLKNGGRVIIDVGKEGSKLGIVTAANGAAIDMLEYKLGDKYPDILKTEAGKKAMQLAIPAAILMLCEIDESGRIPAKDHVRQAAELAVMGTSADAMEAAVSFLLQNGFVILSAYANAGQQLDEDLQVTETFDAEAEMSRVTESQTTEAQVVEPVFQ